MRHLIILLLIMLLVLSIAVASWGANFADTDQVYLWDPSTSTQYYPTFLDMKSAIFTDLGTDCSTQGTIGCAVLWVDDGTGTASVSIDTVTVQDTDPTALTATEGRLTLSTASGNLFFKSADGFFTIQGAYVAD